MNNLTQNINSRLNLITPLGDKVLLPRSMQGRETISELFSFTITCTSTKNIDIKSLICKTACLELLSSKSDIRYFSGMIISVDIKQEEEGQFYLLKLVPQLTLLNYRTNYRIFQNKTALKIIDEIFSEHGIKDYDHSKVRSVLPVLEYCVQYGESDLEFITRLLRQYGIYYFHIHDKNKHKLILADNKQAYINSQKQAKLAYAHETGIKRWQRSLNFISGKWSLNSHDFSNPNKKLLLNQETIIPIANNKKSEIYEYSNNYIDNSDGEKIAKIRIESVESQYVTVSGESSYASFSLGGIITLDEKSFPYEKGCSYVITSLTHQIEDINLNSSQQFYHNEFQGIDAKQVCRPAPPQKRNVEAGVQLGVITGPKGKDIHTDKYGRMKVQFLWDRVGKLDENSSCWMRSIQQWDGLFRIGTPVIISFINNDLDKPIILGPVNNGNLMPINTLPDNQTQSVLKRRHPTKNKEKLYNELRFEDKENSQLLSMYASKNMSAIIEQDFNQEVKKGNYILKVKGDITIQAEGGITLDAKKAIKIQSADSITLSAKQNITLDAKMAVKHSAGTKLSQQAMEINHQAKTKLAQKALEINHQADIRITSKAALQNVEASGLLTLKGGLIKEN